MEIMYYVQTNVACIVILIGLRVTMYKKMGAFPTRELAFYRLIYVTVLMCLSDIFTWTVSGATFNGAWPLLECSNMVYYGALTWACYAWMNYVRICLGGEDRQDKKRAWLTAIPLMIMTVLILTNPLTGYMFSINEKNIYHRERGVVLHWIISLVLKNVCANQRESLFVCRYGGDEFLILGKDVRKEAAGALKENVLRELERVNAGYPAEEAVMISIGLSFGICTNGEDVDALIHMADEMMYREKRKKHAERK